MTASLGLAAAISFGTSPIYVLPGVLNACSPDIQLQMRPVLAAQGQSTALIAYAPSANAHSGFMATVKIPYRQSTVHVATILNALLSTSGLDVTIQYGTAGGVKVPTCIAFACNISGGEGADITAQFTFESQSYPTVGATVTSPGAFDFVWGFQDVTSFTLQSATVYTIVNRFAFRLTRIRAAYVGNSPTGIPQKLGVAYTEVFVDVEMLKLDDAETTTFIGAAVTGAQARHDVVIILTQINPPSQSTPTIDQLTLTANSCFMDGAPKQIGSETEWAKDAITFKANAGGFTIVSRTT